MFTNQLHCTDASSIAYQLLQKQNKKQYQAVRLCMTIVIVSQGVQRKQRLVSENALYTLWHFVDLHKISVE